MRVEDIESMHRLSGIQEGILYHVLSENGADAYIEQGICTIEGPLRPVEFEAAWQQTVNRHGALRTAFLWKGMSKPVQVTYRAVPILFDRQDWSDLSEQEREQKLNALLEAQRRIGQTLNQPPLMRVALVRSGDERWQVVWSIHHLVHDAWSLAIIIRDVLRFYDAAVKGKSLLLPAAPSYTDLLKQQRNQPKSEDEQFWQEYLRGFRRSTAFPPLEGKTDVASHEFARVERRIGTDATTFLLTSLHREAITLNSLVLAAWSVVLASATGEAEVLFGCVSSGRTINQDGIESAVGVFINTLPLRARVPADVPVYVWVRHLQQQQMELVQRETTPLSRIQAHSAIGPGKPLFESIVVYQSAFEGLPAVIGGSLRVVAVRSIGHPNYPLMLRVTPGENVHVEVLYQRSRLPEDTAACVLDCCVTALLEMSADPDRPVSESLSRTKEGFRSVSRVPPVRPKPDLASIRPGAVTSL